MGNFTTRTTLFVKKYISKEKKKKKKKRNKEKKRELIEKKNMFNKVFVATTEPHRLHPHFYEP